MYFKFINQYLYNKVIINCYKIIIKNRSLFYKMPNLKYN